MLERVVFNTNIMVSGLLWRGKPYQCLLLARIVTDLNSINDWTKDNDPQCVE